MMHYWKVRLTCHTPTFIGSGEKYYKSQYIYNEEEKTVSFLREEGWISFINSHGIMDDFIRSMLKQKSEFDLSKYLPKQFKLKKRYGFRWKIIEAMGKAGAIDRSVPYFSIDGTLSGVIGAHVRDIEGNPYIPGSSLKGAFRTAILAHEIRKNLSRYRHYWTELKEASGDERKMGGTVRRLEKELTIPRGGDMMKSYFRGLTVGDAVLIKGDMCVAAKVDLNVDSQEMHQVELYRECFDINSILEFTIGIDDSEAGMGHYGIKSFADLQTMLQEFVDFQYDILQKPFKSRKELQDIENHQNADLFLGGGTGFLSKTLVYSLAPKDAGQFAVEVVRRLLQKRFEKGKHDTSGARRLSPHTLKLVHRNGSNYLMGLCHLKEEKKLC